MDAGLNLQITDASSCESVVVAMMILTSISHVSAYSAGNILSARNLIDAMTEEELNLFIRSLAASELDTFIGSLDQNTVLDVMNRGDDETVAQIFANLDFWIKQSYLGHLSDLGYRVIVYGMHNDDLRSHPDYEIEESLQAYALDVIGHSDADLNKANIARILVSVGPGEFQSQILDLLGYESLRSFFQSLDLSEWEVVLTHLNSSEFALLEQAGIDLRLFLNDLKPEVLAHILDKIDIHDIDWYLIGIENTKLQLALGQINALSALEEIVTLHKDVLLKQRINIADLGNHTTALKAKRKQIEIEFDLDFSNISPAINTTSLPSWIAAPEAGVIFSVMPASTAW